MQIFANTTRTVTAKKAKAKVTQPTSTQDEEGPELDSSGDDIPIDACETSPRLGDEQKNVAVTTSAGCNA